VPWTQNFLSFEVSSAFAVYRGVISRFGVTVKSRLRPKVSRHGAPARRPECEALGEARSAVHFALGTATFDRCTRRAGSMDQQLTLALSEEKTYTLRTGIIFCSNKMRNALVS